MTIPDEDVRRVTARAAIRSEPVVYRLFDVAGTLLYIGSTGDFRSRLRAHARDKSWWPEVARTEQEAHPTIQDARLAEAEAIGAECPRYNTVGPVGTEEVEVGSETASSPRAIQRIWKQARLPGGIPVIYRPPRGELTVRLPYREGNRALLRGPGGRDPTWHPTLQYWTVPAAWFGRLIRGGSLAGGLLSASGQVYVIQPYRETEKCAAACWEAAGEECACSCMGRNHGIGYPGGRWYEVSDACAVRVGDRQLHWKLLTRRQAVNRGCVT